MSSSIRKMVPQTAVMDRRTAIRGMFFPIPRKKWGFIQKHQRKGALLWYTLVAMKVLEGFKYATAVSGSAEKECFCMVATLVGFHEETP